MEYVTPISADVPRLQLDLSNGDWTYLESLYQQELTQSMYIRNLEALFIATFPILLATNRLDWIERLTSLSETRFSNGWQHLFFEAIRTNHQDALRLALSRLFHSVDNITYFAAYDSHRMLQALFLRQDPDLFLQVVHHMGTHHPHELTRLEDLMATDCRLSFQHGQHFFMAFFEHLPFRSYFTSLFRRIEDQPEHKTYQFEHFYHMFSYAMMYDHAEYVIVRNTLEDKLPLHLIDYLLKTFITW